MIALSLALFENGFSEMIAEFAKASELERVLALCDTEVNNDPSVEQRIPDFGGDRPLTLGERKSIARKQDRDLIARALRDPSSEVVRILLGNPILVEGDVIRLCASRPVSPLVLREVFLSRIWIKRYRVKLSLTKNPYTPVVIALHLLPHLRQQDLHEVASSTDLDLRVQMEAQELL